VVDHALAPAGGVAGTVRDAPSGAPLAGVRVAVWVANHSAILGSTTTAADGTYSVIGLDPQSAAWGVEVDLDLRHMSGPNGATYSGQFVGQSSGTVVDLAPGTVARADRALLRNGSISGILRGADTGAPLTGVTLNFGNLQTTTDGDGRFSMTSLPPGAHYAVFAPTVAQGPLGYQSAILQTAPAVNDPVYGWNITVQPGVDTTVDFRLQPAAAIRVSVVDQAGRPIPGATARLFRRFGTTNEVAGDGTGVAMILGLAAEAYNISNFVCAYALPAPGRSVAYETSCVHEPALAYGRAAPVTIVLTAAFGELTTTIYDAVTGQPVSQANVTYTVVDDAGDPLRETYGTSDPTGVAAPVLGSPMTPGPPAPQQALHVRFCVQAEGYQAGCALDDSLDGTSGAVFSTVRGVRTSTQIGLAPT
jgi:5-hydroxyisourate hydrolase-like protein (transthyretin family)